MEFLTELWLPVLVAAVLVFVVSSVTHMVLPYHKSDYRKLANEDAVLEALRTHGVTPGEYMFPCAGSMKEMGTPEMLKKLEVGPVGHMTVLPNGSWNIGKSLLQWFVYSVVVGVFAGYTAWHAHGAGAEYLAVFRTTGTAAMMAYAVGHVPAAIWKGEAWSTTAKFLFDGVLYGLVTAGAFAWLWPAG